MSQKTFTIVGHLANLNVGDPVWVLYGESDCPFMATVRSINYKQVDGGMRPDYIEVYWCEGTCPMYEGYEAEEVDISRDACLRRAIENRKEAIRCYQRRIAEANTDIEHYQKLLEVPHD